MVCKEIFEKLKTLNIPVAYHHFDAPPSVPFAVYYIAGSDVYGADSKNLLKNSTVRIELYTDFKCEELEEKIEKLFSDREIDVSETYIDDQELYEVIFEIEYLKKIGG